MFLTRLTQRDARSQNVVKSTGYCIKQIDIILPSKRGKNISHASRSVLLCSYHVLTSSVRYQSTDARQNEIYLLNVDIVTTC